MTSQFEPTRRRDGIARREGVITGLVGAAAVAVFYFVIDVVRGQPLMTPSVLGEVFLLHTPLTSRPDPAAVVIYTAFHGLVFIAFGLIMSGLVRAAETSAVARYAMVQLLVVFEVFFYGALMVASEQARGLFPFLGVLAANTVALIAMASWDWRHHPALRAAFRHEPLGAKENALRPAARPRILHR